MFKEINQIDCIKVHTNEGEQNLLHICAYSNKHEIMKALLECGLNPNLKDLFGQTPLIQAAVRDSIDCAELLIKYGANINLFNKYQNTALHVAAWNNHKQFCKILIDNKADIMKKNYENKTCLDLAADRGFDELELELDYHFQRELMWRNRNCLLKLYLNKEKTCFKNLSLGVFREIMKYA